MENTERARTITLDDIECDAEKLEALVKVCEELTGITILSLTSAYSWALAASVLADRLKEELA